MILKNVIWILFIILISEIICKENSDEEVFVPTHEWQIVRKGQKIPKGLHVRINFGNGLTEAKLLDEDEEKETKNNALLEVPQENQQDDELLKTDVIKEALKKIKGDDILNVDELKNIKEKFRNYNQLKEELSSLNLTPKIDAEVLRDLFKQYNEEMKKTKISVYTVTRILEDFEFLAHQFDNGIEFVNQNGFNEIIYKNLNLSDSKIKQETLKLFGSLVQNNAKVQIHALETGGIGILLRILNLEKSVQVKSRAIFALSCLLRRFPLAQLRFVENGGFSVIIKILEKDPIKVQIKLVTLLNDLLLENAHALKDNSNENKLVNQYRLVNLENLLLEQNWCEYLNKLLYSLVVTDPENHDSIEKCLLPMHNIANKCGVHYNKDILIGLQKKYQTLALNEDDRGDEFGNSDFFTNLQDLCGAILHQKHIKTEL